MVVAEVDENTDLYEEGHIPGASSCTGATTCRIRSSATSSSKRRFERLLGSGGSRNDTTVVLYGDKNNWFAAYAYWYLKIYGHEDVRILDGGRQKWIDEGRELTTRRRRAAPRGVHRAGARRVDPRAPRPGARVARHERRARSSTCAARRSTRAS